MKKKSIIAAVVVCVIIIACVVPMALRGLDKQDKKIVVGTKDFTEQFVFGYIFKDLIEGNTDYTVDLKEGLGGTEVCFGALKSGEIDLYLEYTGTAYGAILALPNEEGIDMYNEVKTKLHELYGIEAVNRIGFNNTYCLAMRRADIDNYAISKVSDLISLDKKFRITPSFEFAEREDGLKKLQKDYEGIQFSEVIPMDGTLRYIAADSNETDIVISFSTDGMLKKYDLVILEDDLHSMFPYEATPLVREGALKDFPELEDVLNKLSEAISDEDMQYMNYQVDVEQKKPEEVAHQFLVERGLVAK